MLSTSTPKLLNEISPPGVDFHCDLADSEEKFNQLKNDWQRLFDSGANNLYFQSPEWISSWWQFFGESDGYKLAIISVRSVDDGQLQLVWPLVVKRYGVCRAGLWPCQDMGQYGDVLVAENVELENCLEAAWIQLQKSGIDLLKFSQVREDAKVYFFLKKKGQINGDSESTYWVDFEGVDSWDSYMLTRSKNFRKRQKRMLKQFAELGDLSFEVVDNQADIPDVITDLLRIKREWFADIGVYGRVSERAETVEWLIDIALKAQAEGKLNLTILRLNGQIVAGQFALINGRELMAQIGAYDVQYRRFGVGRIQTEDSIRWAFENGYRYFDFMPPYDEYKTSWTNSEIKVENFLCAINLKGKLFKPLFNAKLRTQVKKLYNKIPRSITERFG